MSVQVDVSDAIKKMKNLPGIFNTRRTRAILRKAAEPVKEQAKANINSSDKPHKRYKKTGASGKIKAPKGKGTVVAIYKPGNLKRSIKTLTFRKSKTAVFVGPKLEKRGASGEYGSDAKVDGYYAHMVEFGTVNMKSNTSKGFMRRAASSKKAAAEAIIKKEVEAAIKKWGNQNKV